MRATLQIPAGSWVPEAYFLEEKTGFLEKTNTPDEDYLNDLIGERLNSHRTLLCL